MAKRFPEEFRRDVVAVARRHQAPLRKIAEDFGISEGCRYRWMRQVDVEEGIRDGMILAEQVEVRDLRKRNRLLEQENYILRRAAAYLRQNVLPK